MEVCDAAPVRTWRLISRAPPAGHAESTLDEAHALAECFASARFSVAETEDDARRALDEQAGIDAVLIPGDARPPPPPPPPPQQQQQKQRADEAKRRQADALERFQALLHKYEKEKGRVLSILWEEVFPLLADALPALPPIDRQLVETATRVGDYALGVRLGAGHFSTVCAARHRLNAGACLAVKMVDKGRVKSVTALRRLHNEARSRSRALSPPSGEAGGSGWKRVGREPEPAPLCLSLSLSLFRSPPQGARHARARAPVRAAAL